ncbi:MAG: hypothetical protein MHM6MM_002599 [Cercozoa sp. M6MM]
MNSSELKEGLSLDQRPFFSLLPTQVLLNPHYSVLTTLPNTGCFHAEQPYYHEHSFTVLTVERLGRNEDCAGFASVVELDFA